MPIALCWCVCVCACLPALPACALRAMMVKIKRVNRLSSGDIDTRRRVRTSGLRTLCTGSGHLGADADKPHHLAPLFVSSAAMRASSAATPAITRSQSSAGLA
ncbi:hypothetical protein EON67_12205 [archaeon]|nr:MAG: hypothetical protein EON67_12205 [archaeon]